ncbi:SCO family protein [Niveibacterium sp. SC-1]|uniref:SCO family protein n=1 Tax=Niveibacterium sp. SC-1 TaxID=3135646 RepID=UPI00311F312E
MTRLLVAVLLAFSLAACKQDGPHFNATDISGADYAKDFSLTDHTGKPRHLADFKGKVVTMFFGYTQCPDVCPTTLTNMAQVMKLLGEEDAKRVQVIFVTVDPERDTQQLLAEYVPAFNPGFIGLRGDAAQTEAVERDFKVFSQKQGDVASGRYTVDHTAATYVFDPQGRLRLYVRHGETPQNIASDIKALLAGG